MTLTLLARQNVVALAAVPGVVEVLVVDVADSPLAAVVVAAGVASRRVVVRVVVVSAFSPSERFFHADP